MVYKLLLIDYVSVYVAWDISWLRIIDSVEYYVP